MVDDRQRCHVVHVKLEAHAPRHERSSPLVHGAEISPPSSSLNTSQAENTDISK
jgi:hypothetical protein